MRKILSMMISICAASALFAEDYLFALDNSGAVKRVKLVNNEYKFDDGTPAYAPTFILGQNFGNGGFTFGYNLTPYRSNIGSSIAIGSNTKATQEYAIAFGYDTESAGKNAVAIGRNTKANYEEAIAIGYNATVKPDGKGGFPYYAIAIGGDSIATNANAIALGREAEASGSPSIAIGYMSKALDSENIAIGSNSQATKNDAMAIGQNSKATDDHAVAFGIDTIASGAWSQAIGTGAKSEGKYSNAIGYEAKALGENALAFGYEAEAQKKDSIAFGYQAQAQEKEAIAIGKEAKALKDGVVAIGQKAIAQRDNIVAIGSNAYVDGMNATAIGSGAKIVGDNSIAVGASAQAGYGAKNSIAIGNNAFTQSKNTIIIGSNSQIGKGLNTDNSFNSIAIGNDIKINESINNAIALGYKAEVKSSENIAIGSEAKALGEFASAIGTSAQAAKSATALGNTAKAAYNSTALGSGANSLGENSIAIGTGSGVSQKAKESIVLGAGVTLDYEKSVVIGRSANARGIGAVVIGHSATSNVQDVPYTTALGSSTQARNKGSVALGYGSLADRGYLSNTNQPDVYLIEIDKPASLYKPATIKKDGDVAKTVLNTEGAVSVGKSGKDGFTRQIINVAAGSQDSDAVNVAQLKALNNEINNKGLKFSTNYTNDFNGNNIISKKLGDTLNIKGGSNIEKEMSTGHFSGENIATLKNGENIGLMMKRKPKFDGISFVKNSQDNNPIKIEKSDDTTLTFLSKNGGKTKLTNIAAGTADTDAVNVSQLKENRTKYFSVNSDKKDVGSNYYNDGAIGKDAIAIGQDAIVETDAASSVALGDGAKVEANAASAIAIGHKAIAQKTNSIAIGSNTKASDNSVAIGFGAETGGRAIIAKASYEDIEKKIKQWKKNRDSTKNATRKAHWQKLIDEYEKLLKTYEARYEYNGKQITEADYNALDADQKNKVIITYMSKTKTMYENSVAIGYDAQTLANNAVAIGTGAKVIVDGTNKKIVAGGGVAIGQGSVSNARSNSDLKGYEPAAFRSDKNKNTIINNNKSAWTATNQPFAVGNDKEITRQITGVAAGRADTDAVNVAQLKQIGFHASGDAGAGIIQNEHAINNTLAIQTRSKFYPNTPYSWKSNKLVYTGKNLEAIFIPATGKIDPKEDPKKEFPSRFQIGMTDTPRFKSITIANDKTVEGVDDTSPIELKKFDNNTIRFAGKGDKTVKLTNLTDGSIAKDSKDAVTGKQLYEVQEKTNTLANTSLNFADNNNNIIKRKLGDTLRISGGQTNPIDKNDFAIDGGNIGVFAKDDDNLAIALAKELTGLESVAVGDTKIKSNLITIGSGNDKIIIKNEKGAREITGLSNTDWDATKAKDDRAATEGQLKSIDKNINEKIGNLENNIKNKDFNIGLVANDGKTAQTTKDDKNIKVVGANKNIVTKVENNELKIGLNDTINLAEDGSIKFTNGKTDITKDKVTSKDLVAKGDKQVTISGDKGTVEGLTNTTWDKNNIVENRAATEGQLQSLQNNLENNLNNTIGTTLGSYKIKGDDGVHNIYDNKILTIKGDKNIKTKATEDGNLDIKLSKNLDLKDGSITLNNAKLDENGLTVGDNVKITKYAVQNGDVKLTKDGLDNGGKKITKVADGEADDDAATVGQLKNIAVGASGVKESDKKDDWAKEKPKATGKNSVSIAGGSTDGGRNNTVSVGSKGNQRTISNVAPGVLNSDAATVGQLKAGLNNVHGKLDEYKKDSRAGTASAMAIGNLPQSTIPGKGMVSLGGGFYDGESAMAIGLSKMSDDGKWVVKGSASYDSQENAGAAVSVGFHF